MKIVSKSLNLQAQQAEPLKGLIAHICSLTRKVLYKGVVSEFIDRIKKYSFLRVCDHDTTLERAGFQTT